MPLYEYKCKTCAEEFEQARAVADCKKKTTCPKCKKTRAVSLLLSAVPGKVLGGTPRFHP